jgi:hypothetical protein
VKVRATDTAMGDLYVDIGLLPCLGFVSLPFHIAIYRVLIKPHPALEGVIGRCHLFKMQIFEVRVSVMLSAVLIMVMVNGRSGGDMKEGSSLELPPKILHHPSSYD